MGGLVRNHACPASPGDHHAMSDSLRELRRNRRNDARIFCRRLWPSDIDTVRAFILRLDSETRANRFLAAVSDATALAYAERALVTKGLVIGGSSTASCAVSASCARRAGLRRDVSSLRWRKRPSSSSLPSDARVSARPCFDGSSRRPEAGVSATCTCDVSTATARCAGSP